MIRGFILPPLLHARLLISLIAAAKILFFRRLLPPLSPISSLIRYASPAHFFALPLAVA